MATTHKLAELLEKTGDFDKDERYMATSDLCAELERDVALDAAMERNICTAILSQLDDVSNDVQSIAVKCLALLVRRVKEEQIREICDKLVNHILTGKDELRDIYSIGLKTLITAVPPNMAELVSGAVSRGLLDGVQQDGKDDLKLECLDILTDLLKRFGNALAPVHDELAETLLSQVAGRRVVIRKRATACLGWLSLSLSDAGLHALLEAVLTNIEAEGDDVRSWVQAVGTISRTVGFRMGRHLDRMVPLFLRFCGSRADVVGGTVDPDEPAEEEEEELDGAAAEARNELRENLLAALESFLTRCPSEVSAYVDAILERALYFAAYDPNYSYDSDDDDDGDDDGEDWGDDGEDWDAEYSDDDGGADDDDSSWKVRRAAIKVIAAVTTSRPDMLSELYARCATPLVRRFKEREEAVKLDVLAAFRDLLAAMVVETKAAADGGAAAAGVPRRPALKRQRSGVTLLSEALPSIVPPLLKQLTAGSSKTKAAVLSVLSTLTAVLGSELHGLLAELLPAVLAAAVEDASNSVKLDALQVLHALLRSQSADALLPHIEPLASAIIDAVGSSWYKMIAEALRCVTALTAILRPHGAAGADAGGEAEAAAAAWTTPLYDAVLTRLQAHDIDQEIKACAIAAAGSLLASLGDLLDDKTAGLLSLLAERLGNEITRVPALRALEAVARSPLAVDLSTIFAAAVAELGGFLRQESRQLKQTALTTLDALVTAQGGSLSDDAFETLMDQASALLTDDDLLLAHLSLTLAVSGLRQKRGADAIMARSILPAAMSLAGSPLLQGAALHSLQLLFSELQDEAVAELRFSALLDALLQPTFKAGADLPRQSVANVASCVAALTQATTDDLRSGAVARFIDDVRSEDDGSADGAAAKRVALLCLGEIGRRCDLSAHGSLHATLLSCFAAEEEMVKSAAAVALGNVAVGGMDAYLSAMLEALAGDAHTYLLLTALRQTIVLHDGSSPALSYEPYVEAVVPALLPHGESADEGVRTMAAECLGRLAMVQPERILSQLESLLADASAHLRFTIVTSLKYCVTAERAQLALSARMETFLQLLHDDDLDVRRAALLCVNATAHHQPALVKELLADFVLPQLFGEMEVKEELKREVHLGPFKHKVDDGLPLRKAAFGCMDTILNSMAERVRPTDFLPYLQSGLTDDSDVQLLCHQILVKLVAWAPGAVLAAVDDLIAPLGKAVNKKVKEGAVGTAVDRVNELIRSALRAVRALDRLPDIQLNKKWPDFMRSITRKPHLVAMLEEMDAVAE